MHLLDRERKTLQPLEEGVGMGAWAGGGFNKEMEDGKALFLI